MTDIDNVQTIVDTAVRATAPAELELGKFYAFHTPEGVHTVNLTGDNYRDAPARKSGTTTVRDATSWLAYYEKHHDDDTEVFSDVEQLTVTAVLDANTATAARWGGHRLQLRLRQTKAWKDWAQHDGKLIGQEQFATFLEDHLPDLVDPDAATMLEIAQSIQATTQAQFQSGTRLHSGERKLVYTEETSAKAGGRGELTIPEVFQIGIVPFEGAVRYSMRARLRYRIERSELRIGFKLEQPEDRIATAFREIADEIAAAINVPVVNGSPGS